MCIALHFLTLAWIFDDWSYALLTLVQVAGLAAMFGRLRRAEAPTSRWAAPWVGVTFLAYALISAVVFLVGRGYPW